MAYSSYINLHLHHPSSPSIFRKLLGFLGLLQTKHLIKLSCPSDFSQHIGSKPRIYSELLDQVFKIRLWIPTKSISSQAHCVRTISVQCCASDCGTYAFRPSTTSHTASHDSRAAGRTCTKLCNDETTSKRACCGSNAVRIWPCP